MNASHVAKRLLFYIKPYKKLVYIAIFASFIQVMATLLIPLVIGQMIDHAIRAGVVHFDVIGQLLIVFFILIIIASATNLIVNRSTNSISFHTVADLRNQVMQKLNTLPLETIDNTQHGTLMNIMIADVDVIGNGLLQGGAQFLTGVLTIIGTLFLMFYTQVNITLLVLLLTPISLIVAQFIAKRVYRRYQAQTRVRGDMSAFLEEIISNKPVLINLAYEEQAEKRFTTINERLYTKGWRAHFAAATLNPSTRVINNLIYACVGVYGAILVGQQLLTIGALSAFLSYANQYMKPFNEISAVMAELQAALASCERVFTILDLPNEAPDARNPKTLNTIQGALNLEDVTFSYTDVPFIENLNFSTRPGQTVAIVGPTGCGKTTLINLLMRFYELQGGRILIDDIDSLAVQKATLRGAFGMVLQDSWIFTGTVRDNIAYGKPTASFPEILDAAQKAQIHHAIEQLPDGYDTVLSSKYDTLSQGQKQLLCIARIMLLDPPMLILDEATSNIDTRTEIAINETFQTMMEGRTSFIIAHRLSTIQNADVILVMRNGTIVETGTHKELLNKKGYYTELYNSQFANR